MVNKNKKVIIFLVAVISIYALERFFVGYGLVSKYTENILISILISIILAVSLNLTIGFLGQLALGHAGFMAIGAYTSAILFLYTNISSLYISMLIGGLLASVVGVIICVPTLRLKGDYLAIVTLAFNEIIRNLIESSKITNGSQGLSKIPKLTNFTNAYIITCLVVAIVFLLINSRHGRAIISIREDEIASESSGINPVKYKLLAFCLSAFFAGLAGALYAHQIMFIAPKNFGFDKSIEIAIMVVLGGVGNIYGSIASATVLTALPQILISFEKWRMLIYSIILILYMVLKANGTINKITSFIKSKLNFKKNDEKKV